MEMEMREEEGEEEGGGMNNTPDGIQSVSSVITSLDGTSVTFTPSDDGIKREGNTIIHHGSDRFWRNCFIGGEMTSVCNLSSFRFHCI